MAKNFDGTFDWNDPNVDLDKRVRDRMDRREHGQAVRQAQNHFAESAVPGRDPAEELHECHMNLRAFNNMGADPQNPKVVALQNRIVELEGKVASQIKGGRGKEQDIDLDFTK